MEATGGVVGATCGTNVKAKSVGATRGTDEEAGVVGVAVGPSGSTT
jgi:hypothetical protein